MLQYFKLLVLTIISSIFSALPFSSSGAFAYLNNSLSFTSKSSTADLYYSIISLAFAVVAMFFLRKVYIGAIKNISKKSGLSAEEKKPYRNMFVGMALSLIPALVMIIPTGKGKFVCDYFSSFLVSSDMLVVAFSSIFCAFLAFVTIIISRRHNFRPHKTSKLSDVIRMSVYNIIPNIFPGFSRVFLSSVSLCLSGVNELIIVRDVLLYLAPSTLVISIFRLVRAIVGGATVEPVMIAICAVVSVICNAFVIKLATKINIRKSFAFYSLFSLVFGVLVIVTVFVIK